MNSSVANYIRTMAFITNSARLQSIICCFHMWEEFCKFVRKRHTGYSSVPEPATDSPWKMTLIDLIEKMKENFFNEKQG